MCKPDKPDPVDIDAPEYLRNPFLDQARNPTSAARALRAGRSSLRIPLAGSAVAINSSSGAARGTSQTLGPRGNGGPRPAGGGTGGLTVGIAPRVRGITV